MPFMITEGTPTVRIPLTICDYDREKGTVEIVVQAIGAETFALKNLKKGDQLADVVGPLGKPSDLCEESIEDLKKKKIVFIAGGVGTAPVYPQAKWLKEHGVDCDVIIGAKTRDLIIYKEEMQAVCDNLYICTDDGSEGFKGLVTAMLEKLVNEDGKTYDHMTAGLRDRPDEQASPNAGEPVFLAAPGAFPGPRRTDRAGNGEGSAMAAKMKNR